MPNFESQFQLALIGSWMILMIIQVLMFLDDYANQKPNLTGKQQ